MGCCKSNLAFLDFSKSQTVSHGNIFQKSSRIIFMDQGVIVEEGPAAEVINNPQHQRTREFLATYEG